MATEEWTNSTFQAGQPLGYSYPLNQSCPLTPFQTNRTALSCMPGNSAMYAVKVMAETDIIAAIEFATAKNLRVVIKSTGHDFLQR